MTKQERKAIKNFRITRKNKRITNTEYTKRDTKANFYNSKKAG